MSGIFRRRDLSGLAKAGWLVFVVLVPLLGVLADLRDRGVITDEEFQKGKVQLPG